MTEQRDVPQIVDAEPEALTAVGKLFEKHIAVTRTNLRIANSFSAMREFEKNIGKLKGVESLVFDPVGGRGGVSSGIIRLQLRKGGDAHVAGSWKVDDDGQAFVEFPGVASISCLGPNLGTELRRLLGSKQLKLIIDRVVMEANLASFLPDFGEDATADALS
jgi:hypothetical protein